MNNLDLLEILANLSVVYIPFLFSLCFHEFAHAWMARRKGDNTAELMGRLTMNPFAHADLIGTVVLPISGFLGNPFAWGWAKPVPVNERNLRRPKEDMFWIALAGPLSNFLLATIGALVCAALMIWGGMENRGHMDLARIAFTFVVVNLMLGCFNLIPLHPLDGGKVLARFLPYQWNVFLERHAFTLNIVLVALFLLGIFSFFGRYVVKLAEYLTVSVEFVLRSVF